MATYTKTLSSGWAQLILTITTSSQSIENNTSKLKCILQLKKLKNKKTKASSGSTIYMQINGSKIYTATSFDIATTKVNGVKTLSTKYVTVNHGSDGKKSVSCVGYFKAGSKSSAGTATAQGNYTPSQIPQLPSLTVSKNSLDQSVIVIDKPFTWTTSPIYKTNTRMLVSYYGDCNEFPIYDDINISGNSISGEHTLSMEDFYCCWSSSNVNSSDATGHLESVYNTVMTASVVTGNDDETKGKSVPVTISVPSTLRPAVKSLTLSPRPIIIKKFSQDGGDSVISSDRTYTDIVIMGHNWFDIEYKIACKDPKYDKYGGLSTITLEHYRSSNDVSAVKHINTYGTYVNNGSFTVNPKATQFDLSNGKNVFYVKVKDLRGINGDFEECSVNIVPYHNPSFLSFNVERSDDNKQIRYTGTIKCAPVRFNDKNRNNLVITYSAIPIDSTTVSQVIKKQVITGNDMDGNGVVNFDFVISDLDENIIYNVQARVVDGVDGVNVLSEEVILKGSVKIFNIPLDGNGIAFGKMANQNNDGEGDGFFDVIYPIKYGSRNEQFTLPEIQHGTITTAANETRKVQFQKEFAGTPTVILTQVGEYFELNLVSATKTEFTVKVKSDTSSGTRTINWIAMYTPT